MMIVCGSNNITIISHVNYTEIYGHFRSLCPLTTLDNIIRFDDNGDPEIDIGG